MEWIFIYKDYYYILDEVYRISIGGSAFSCHFRIYNWGNPDPIYDSNPLQAISGGVINFYQGQNGYFYYNEAKANGYYIYKLNVPGGTNVWGSPTLIPIVNTTKSNGPPFLYEHAKNKRIYIIVWRYTGIVYPNPGWRESIFVTLDSVTGAILNQQTLDVELRSFNIYPSGKLYGLSPAIIKDPADITNGPWYHKIYELSFDKDGLTLLFGNVIFHGQMDYALFNGFNYEASNMSYQAQDFDFIRTVQ